MEMTEETKIMTATILHWQKFSNVNETFNRVFGIPVSGHISAGIFIRIGSYYCQNSCWNVSVYWDPNDSFKRVVYVAKFLSVSIGMGLCNVTRKSSGWDFEETLFAVYFFYWRILTVWSLYKLKASLVNYLRHLAEGSTERLLVHPWRPELMRAKKLRWSLLFGASSKSSIHK